MEDVQVYYYPVYAYRSWVSNDTVISDIISRLIHDDEILFYKNEKEAREKADSWLCDDDSAGAIKIEVSHGDHFTFYPVIEDEPLIGFTNHWLMNRVVVV